MSLTIRFMAAAAALIGLALTSGALAEPAPRPERADVKIAVGGKSLMVYLPLAITERLGYFKDAGLDVQIIDVGGGAKGLQALIGGSVDVTAGSFDHTIQLQATGQTVTAVVLMARYPGIVLGLVAAKNMAYAGPQDLRGKRVGVTAPGSQTNFMVNYLMAKAGLKPDDAAFIGVGGAASAVAAVRSGEIDALSHADPAMSQLELSNEIRVVADTRTTEGTRAVFGGPYPSSVLYVKPDFAANYPGTTQALVNAVVRALHWIERATPEDIAKAIPDEAALANRDLMLAVIRNSKGMYTQDGRFARDGVDNAHKVLAAFDPAVASARIDLSLTYTDRFIEKVPGRHR